MKEDNKHVKEEVAQQLPDLIDWTQINTKEEVQKTRDQFVELVRSGEVSAEKMFAAIHVMNLVFSGNQASKGVKSLIYADVLEQVSKQRGGIEVGNFIITSGEAGVKYDYSRDPVWVELMEKRQELDGKIKLREARLKSAPAPDALNGIQAETELDQETGEVFDVLPPLKRSTTVPKISFIKNPK